MKKDVQKKRELTPEESILLMRNVHEEFMKRYMSAKRLADVWASLLEACFHFAVPFRNRFYRPVEAQGETKNARLYDTTAVEATKTFVSKLQDAMTPPQVQWGYLQIDEGTFQGSEDDFNNKQMEVDDYMRRLFDYIHQSNFDVVVNECYFDLAIGTSSIVINQGTDENPLMMTSVPIDKLAIEEAANGKIESWYRTWDDLRIAELKTRWRKIRITDSMILDTLADPSAKISKIYEGVMYKPNDAKPYKYIVCNSEDILLYEELESNPGIVWRFQKTNNEVWGRGPVMEALPSIISLNEMARIELASANLNAFKPYMAFSDAVFNPHTFKLEPFSVIPIAPIGMGGQVPLIPLPDSSNPQFAQLTMQDLRLQIKALLFAETAADSLSVQPQTAFELSLRQQTLAQKIGPLFSRLQQEFHWPVIERCAYILEKMGLLPRPKLNGAKVKFIYKSPLALSKGQQDIARLTQFVQLMQGIMGPDGATLYINPKETPYLMAQMMQIDPRFLNNVDEVAQVMQNTLNKADAAGQVQEAATQQVQTGNPALEPFQR